ncbi:MAG TPA: LLM class flavin-dependent oxidoreductase [Stellaceae bacterium]|jgi:alkanesulfonate monooxygenase SsuD/methylene tetrahydromethanopterin reductase-like flavin-dependent oxidoreductase (luciferase family)|nr:LLM class flavin-dependent oxidoreductase [Stellaceae bacterium]
MAFEFGMFHEFQRPSGVSDEQAFATSFEQVDAAERWGLDAMWLAEIHIAPERSVLSAPLTLASAIAARTKRMKIGTAVQVLPLCHPLRLAEEAATVDQISHGRLIFGVGRSGFPRTYEAYGVPYGESRDRFAETLEILKKAWTEDTFSYKGQYYNFDNVRLTPKPYQKPWPEIRVAANSADTFPAIAKLGHAVFVAVRLGTLEELEPNITAYRKAWKEAGHPGEGKVFLRAPVYVADTDKQAIEEPEESIMYFYRYLGERLEDSASRSGVRAVEDRTARGRRLQTISYEDAMREKIIVGSAEKVADRLMGLKEKLGLDGILAEMNCGTKIPHERVMRSLQLLCEKVSPRFN